MIIDIVKIFIPATVAFIVGILLTPFWTNYLYKNEMWKKKAGKTTFDGKEAEIFNSLHKEKEVGTPKMGGVIIWLSVFLTVMGVWLTAQIFPGDITTKLDFMSRNQTWIPLFTLIFGAFVGLCDDLMDIRGVKDNLSGGLSFKKRILIVAAISLAIAFWFYFKLDVATVAVPFYGNFFLGWIFIPFFVLVTIAVYSGGIIDGLDGLAGGIFASMFAAYAGIAFYENHINLAAFCGAVLGGILAFLWFNIPPARFYMSETGSMALTITLSVVAFMTDSLGEGVGVLVLPIIALPLLVTTLSVIIQLLSKKYRNGKKVFRVAPLHHHFEAIGWPAYKVTMRYWILGIIFALLGMIISLVG
ncbi:MAG: hypothetical protein WCT19_01020 [Candidatus Paceibacterota bacterium]